MKIYDISLPMSTSTAEWPGDAKFELAATMAVSHGDTVNVGRMTTSLHMATHVDAPRHIETAGASIDELPLDTFLGPCHLLDVRGLPRIQVRDLAGIDFEMAPRLLLRTGVWLDHRVFPTEIPVLEERVPQFLGERGVRLVGLDVPSVDPIESKKLPIHRALHDWNIQILESLDLSQPPPGYYELQALPLKIIGGDASPVRAVLISR